MSQETQPLAPAMTLTFQPRDGEVVGEYVNAAVALTTTNEITVAFLRIPSLSNEKLKELKSRRSGKAPTAPVAAAVTMTWELACEVATLIMGKAIENGRTPSNIQVREIKLESAPGKGT